jgi:DNA-binding NtrC family response regulator
MARRLLIIDDDAAVVAFLTEELSNYFDVTGEVSPVAALARVLAEDFDLVIADVEMPQLRGTDLLRAIIAAKPEQAVFMITAFGSSELAHELMRDGARDVIAKPFTIGKLRASISTWSDRDRARLPGAPAPR